MNGQHDDVTCHVVAGRHGATGSSSRRTRGKARRARRFAQDASTPSGILTA